MKNIESSIRTGLKRSIMGFGVATLTLLAASQPALATIYKFTIPTGAQGTPNPDPNSILGALDIGVLNAAIPGDPLKLGFYDFYIRPQLSSDGTIAKNQNLSTGSPGNPSNPLNLITDYSMAASTATPPVPGCVSPIASGCTSTYTGTTNVTEPVGGASIHFTFSAADNTIALVSNQPNAGNKTYAAGGNNPFPASITTEIMPSAAAFAFTLTTSEYSAYQTPKITFQIYGLAVQYTTTGATVLAAKNVAYIGDFDAVGTAPEPSTIFIAGGGLCLVGLIGRRRRNKL